MLPSVAAICPTGTPGGPAGRCRLVEVDHADLDVLLAVAAPVPELVALDRAADFEAEVVDVLDRRARARALRANLVGDVVGLERVVRVVDAAAALEAIGSAARHEVDADAAGLLRRIRAAGRDLHLLHHVEVVVDRRGAGRRHVGDVHAVERPLVVAGAGAAADVARLLAGLAAADVDAIHRDVRHALEHDPRVARRRDVLQRLEVEGRLGRGGLGVDDRALAADRHRFLNGRDRQLLVDLGREADADDDALADDRLEAGQLELHRVGADRNQRETEASGFAARRRLRLDERRAGQRHGCTWQHSAGVVGDSARDFTGLDLRQRRHRTHQYGQHGQHGGKTHFHLQPPLENERTNPPTSAEHLMYQPSEIGRRPVVGLSKCLEIVVKWQYIAVSD